jgi:hypothetical protein
LAALFGALTWATGLALWGQATIAEVYGLWALFTALCLYLALRLDAARRGGRPAGPWSWALLGLAAGIGLGAHLALALLAPGLALLLWPTLVAGGARPAPPRGAAPAPTPPGRRGAKTLRLRPALMLQSAFIFLERNALWCDRSLPGAASRSPPTG